MESTISIYANAFSVDAQVAPDIASTSASASATPTLNLRVPMMPGGALPLASHAPSVDPFEQEVTSLENRRIEFSQRPIIFYGSSSIRRWETLSEDFIGYPVVNCGFGGSRLIDCVRYVSRLVLRLKPAAVVVYAGDNDLAQGALPDQAFASFRDLYGALRGYSEQMPIAYISVKPCPARIRYIDNILRFNQMVQAFLQNQPATKYINTSIFSRRCSDQIISLTLPSSFRTKFTLVTLATRCCVGMCRHSWQMSYAPRQDRKDHMLAEATGMPAQALSPATLLAY